MFGPPPHPEANLQDTKELFPAFGTVNLSVNWHDMWGARLGRTFFVTNAGNNVWALGTFTQYETLGYQPMVRPRRV